MGKAATDLTNECLKTISEMGGRAAKNVRGFFRQLKTEDKIRAGLSIPGSSDIIGWHSVIITEEMVGARVAIYLAAEVKVKDYPSDDQKNFIAQVKGAGGIAGVVRSKEDVIHLLKGE